MGKVTVATTAFNRGVVSPLGLARVDIERLALSAETQTNWMPRSLGSMMLRAGTGYKATTLTNQYSRSIPFIFSTTDKAIIELTDSVLRVLINDAAVTRTSVSTAITNGLFTSDIASWTDDDDSGATSSWASSGYLALVGTGFLEAARYQAVTVAAGDVGVEHALNIVIATGPVTLRVGSSATTDDYIGEVQLGEGSHSLTFTPTGTFYIRFSSSLSYQVEVDSVAIASGEMQIATPWDVDQIDLLQYHQSADVIYIACDGVQQYKIERRSTRSWSVVKYLPIDGPFKAYNTTGITLTPSSLSGTITLTANRGFFSTSHVGQVYRIDSIGQATENDFTAEDQFSNYIRVTGIESARKFTITRAGTWSATVTLQRSIGEPGSWVDITTYTTNATTTYDDGLDNQIIYYRVGIKTGDYTSGTAEVDLAYANGSSTGRVKVTAYSTSQQVVASVLSDLGGTDATKFWAEGYWSDVNGYPSSVCIYEGRVWWAGKSIIWGTVSDSYESFDDEVSGDSGPITRSIGSGPVDTINWLLPLQRLIIGSQGAELSCRSSSFDEPLSPTAFSIKDASTQGSAQVNAIKYDTVGLFVQRSGTRVYQLTFDGQAYDYASSDLTILAPQIGEPSIVRIGVQRQPDTRVHCIRSDGKVAILVTDRVENVTCWVLYETDGVVEDVCVLPGDVEDDVYYTVKRTINGSTKRYIEKWAKESECQGGTLNKQADSHIVYSGASTTSITGLSHLEGESVVVWGDGAYNGTYTVSSGAITLDTAVEEAIIGLGYTADYKSAKLAYAASMGSALNQLKKVSNIGLNLYNTHYRGVTYGPDFDNLDDLPAKEDGVTVAADTIHAVYDEEMFTFAGEWDTDSRVCLRAVAPYPVTILAMTMTIQTNDNG